MSFKSFFHKCTHWEHWPSFMFYIPNLPYSFYLAIKAKSPVFYTATNPAIEYSGDGLESKFKTIQLIPEKLRPKTILIKCHFNFKQTLKEIQKEEIEFPLIAKPDIGFRGVLVKKIDTKKELEIYLEKNQIDIIIQEFIQYSNECGIFYHRLPNEEFGTITSITLKKFLSVHGDGSSTLSELILSDSRAYLYFDLFEKIHSDRINKIPRKNEKIDLTVIGNHSKGTQFLNGNHLINNKLTNLIDGINKNITGWFYGRLDIKYESFEELIQGKNFKILELNGIISEPTHIYDPTNYTYRKALKTIRTHWKIIYKIGTINHNQYGVIYSGKMEFIRRMIKLKKYSNNLKKLVLK